MQLLDQEHVILTTEPIGARELFQDYRCYA